MEAHIKKFSINHLTLVFISYYQEFLTQEKNKIKTILIKH